MRPLSGKIKLEGTEEREEGEEEQREGEKGGGETRWEDEEK